MDILTRTQLKKASELLASATEQPEEPSQGIGLSAREIRSYSILKAIKAKWDSITRGISFDGIEAEAHRALCAKLGHPPNVGRIYIPHEILTRDLTAGTAGAGGYLIGTTTTGSFVEVLRNRALVFRLGAQRLSGQSNQVALPRQSGSATAYWLATEATAVTESQQSFEQISLNPKTVGAYTEISDKLLRQSNPSAEAIVMADLAAVLGVAVDAAVINGSGTSGQPTGILNITGIGSVSGTSLGYDGLCEFQSDVAGANAVLNEATLGYLTTVAVAKLLKGRQRFTGTDTPLWQGSVHSGMIEGVRAYSTLQVPTASMLYGDWSQVVVAEWGVLAVEVNPFADFKAGIIGVRALWTIDVGVRHAASFSVATAIT